MVPSTVTATTIRARLALPRLTFDLLALLVADVPRHLEGVADERRTAGELHGAFNLRVELDGVDRQSSTFESAESLGDGFDLDGVQGDERRLAGTLVAHVLDAVDSRLFVVHHDGINVPAEDSHDGTVILLGGGSTEVDDSPVHTREHALEAREGLLELDLALVLALIHTCLEELIVDVLKALVDLGLLQAGEGQADSLIDI